MDLEAICWFVDVVYHESFAAAARHLQQPGSNVSRRIAQLEKSLGAPLLIRTTRSLALTPEGQAFLPLAQRLKIEQDNIFAWSDSLKTEPSGAMRITAPSSFARGPLTDWLVRYRKRYPKVDVELIHSNDYLDFQEHQLDFAFRQGPLPDSVLVAQRIFSIHYGVFVSPSLLNECETLSNPSQLQAQNVIVSAAQKKALPWRFKDMTWQPKNPVILFEDIGQCLIAAKSGLGFTYASRYEATPFLDTGELVEVLIEHRPSPIGFYLVSPGRKYRSLKSEAFLSHVNQEILNFGKPDGLSF